MRCCITPAAAITLQVGGKTMAQAADYTVLASRACCAVEASGETEPLAMLPGTTRYTLQLREVLWEDAVDYDALGDFAVRISRNGRTVQYSGCRWTAVEEAAEKGLLWQRATLVACRRTEVADGNL